MSKTSKSYNINKHIQQILLNEYGGSTPKKTVILDDGNKYMLKFTTPRSQSVGVDRAEYGSSVVSEHLACRIFASIGIPVQETILGQFLDRHGYFRYVCACRDVRAPGEQMYEIDKLLLGCSEIVSPRCLSLPYMHKVFRLLSDLVPEKQLCAFYYDMLIADALVGIPDRRNKSWALLVSDAGLRISPVYGCDAAFAPWLGVLGRIEEQEALGRKYALDAYSVLYDAQGKRIKYSEIFSRDLNSAMQDALKRIVPRINLVEIDHLICTEVSDPEFYMGVVHTTYERILLPAYERSL